MPIVRLLEQTAFLRFKLAKLRTHLLPPRGALVLDLGSGDGPTPAADVLCDRFVADDTERTAAVCLDRPFVSGDAEALPFRDRAFDFVYCSHLLEHTRRPGRAIAELERVARGGYIEVPSEYMEKAAKSISSHLWFVRIEDGVLVFSPKRSGILDPRLNQIFEERLLREDRLFRAFYWARFYSLFNIGLQWVGKIPHRIEEVATEIAPGSFEKGRDALPSPEEVRRIREESRRVHAVGVGGGSSGIRRWIKGRIRGGRAARRSVDLFDLIACPICKGSLQEERGGEALACGSCGVSYPQVEGIPFLLPGLARGRAGAGGGGAR